MAVLATGGRADQARDFARRVADGAATTWAAAAAMAPDPLGAMGFRTAAVRLKGSSAPARDEILRAVGVKTGEPLFGLDLGAIRARVEAVGWVEHARIIRLLPDTLVIAVTQRPLMAVWQHGGRRQVVAANGRVVGGVDPDHFRTLPLIIGEGADSEAAALFPLVQVRPRLAARLRAVRRVDFRRWDLLLKDGGVVQLAANGEADSLSRLDRLDASAKILDLKLAKIDLRDAKLTVVRPGAPTVALGPSGA